RPPPLDPDLDALNRLPRFRPLVLAPTNNRLSGLFNMGVRYIVPTAEQLNLDETELTGLCFSFRDYVTDRAQRVCDRQAELACAARHIGTCAADTQTRLAAINHQAKLDHDGLSVIKSLQKQAEKSYELIQDILHDLERLEAVLPGGSRIADGDAHASAEFPCLTRMLAQRRRSSLHSASPRTSVALRRHIATKNAGVPSFPARTTSITSLNLPRASRQPGALPESSAGSVTARPGPYRLPPLARQSSTIVPVRSHSKRTSDSRSLRPRTSQSSVTGGGNGGGPSSERSHPSVPSSPTAADLARVSFDGESIGMQAASISALAATDAPRSVPKRPAQPFGSLRPLRMVRSVYGDRQGSYSRSEVSLSREQVVWSPQISSGANDSAFGYGDQSDALAHLALSDAEFRHAHPLEHVTTPGTVVSSSDDNRSSFASSGPLSVPMDISGSLSSGTDDGRRLSGFRRGRLSVSVVRDAGNADTDGAVYSSAGPPVQNGGGSVFDPATVLGPARIPPLRSRPPIRAPESPVSPRSLPHALSLQSASSAGSTPTTPSMRPPTPIGSPSSQAATSQLVATVAPTAPQDSRQSPMMLPPQYPLEAARMLKQMMADRGTGTAEARSASRCSTPQETTPDDHYRMTLAPNAGADYSASAGGQAYSYSAGIAGPGGYQRSRTSSLAASQQSATEGSDGAEQIRSAGTVRAVVEGRAAGDLIRGSGPWASTNPERMSTWSSSSARTLADGLASSRVSSADDQFRASKRPLSSAALATLTASAAMISRQARAHGGSSGDGSRKIPTTHSGGVRIAGGRPVVDLGLSIRTDLEQRVRSYSESGRNPLLQHEDRPHSSMGFHDTAVWGARPSSLHLRHHSPLSASLRQLRADKLNPNRRSAMSIRSRGSKPGSLSAGLPADDAPGDDTASIGTSYSSNGGGGRLPHPTAAAALAVPPLPAAALDPPALPAATGKRRARTMDNQD
ncbi:hypothetical protein H4R19_003448, partial [Coemansia spiralis]